MSNKSDDLEVGCPICNGTLSVDRETGHVVHAEPAEGGKPTFESALGDVLSGETRRDSKFRKAFDSEAKRVELLDKKFDKAKQKAEETPGKPRHPFDRD